MTLKINSWVRAIKRIDERMKREQVEVLVKSINSYFGVNIRSERLNKQHIIARKVYYKYGIESGIPGSILSLEIKRVKDTASNSRIRFTKSFSSNPANKEVYHKFKEYIENNK